MVPLLKVMRATVFVIVRFSVNAYRVCLEEAFMFSGFHLRGVNNVKSNLM